MTLFKKKKRMLVLGGGGARGLVSIGVLKAYEEIYGRDNLPFDMIIGTSMGALIGAGYCLGISLDELERLVKEFNPMKIFDISLNGIRGKKFEQYIKNIIKSKSFKDMKIPFGLTTVDLVTKKEVFYTEGNLLKLVRASCSWPGIFAPVKVGDMLLVDGGIRNSIPTKMALEEASSHIVAVDPGWNIKSSGRGILQGLIASIQVMGDELNNYQANIADMTIKPELGDINQTDFNKADEIIRIGYLTAQVELEKKKTSNLVEKGRDLIKEVFDGQPKGE